MFSGGSFAQGLPQHEDDRFIFVSDMELALEYETNGVLTRIINSPAEEAIKHGFSLGLEEDDPRSKYILHSLESLRAIKSLAKALKMSRLFGGSIIIMMVDDGKDLTEPLSLQNVHKIIDLRVYDRTEATPDCSSFYKYNSSQPWKTGELEYYDINLAYGGNFKVHESRCLKFTNGDLVSQSQYQQYQFWGLPEYYRIAGSLKRYKAAHAMSVKMLEKAVQPIYKGNLQGTMSAAEGEGRIKTRLNIISRIANRFRYIGIDKATEDITFAQASLAGLQEALAATQNELSADSEIPQTKLFGRSPAGMNATGESDLELWYNKIERMQIEDIKDPLTILIDVIIQAGIFANKINDRPEIKLEFSPLWSLSDKEQAEIDRLHAQIDELKAKTTDIYCEMGALDPSDVRCKLEKDGAYEIKSHIPTETNTLPSLSKLLLDISGKTLKTDGNSDKIQCDGGQRFIHINGANVPVGDDGELQGEAGDKIASVGKNTFDGFDKGSAKKHLDKRQKRDNEYIGMTAEQYEQTAITLLEQGVGGDIDGFIDKRGQIIRYNKATQDYAIGERGARVVTMFKCNQNRFESLKARDKRDWS